MKLTLYLHRGRLEMATQTFQTTQPRRNPIPVTVIARSSVNSSVRERQIIVKSIMLKVPGPGRALAMEP